MLSLLLRCDFSLGHWDAHHLLRWHLVLRRLDQLGRHLKVFRQLSVALDRLDSAVVRATAIG